MANRKLFPVLVGHGTRKRVQRRLFGDYVLDGCSATMGMDSDFLVCVPWTEHGWYTSVWRDRILAVTVSPSAQIILHIFPGTRVLKNHILTSFVRVKVISITIFFVVAIVISAGGIGGQKIGFKYWHDRESTYIDR